MVKHLKFLALFTASILPVVTSSAALAHWGKTTITDGNGDGVQIQHHLLGQKDMRMQDQLGDGFVYKRGLFGMNKTEAASVLGNGIKIHHGLISGTSIEGQSMFGDTFKSHKIFGIGPRNTTVDVHGISSVASSLFGGHHMNMSPGGGGIPGLNNSAVNAAPGMPMEHPGDGFRPEGALPGAGAMPEANPTMRPGMVDPNAFASPAAQ